ncbi:MAG TPA: long-chain fatty acid--CoA ligase [Actinomycetota bacterium]|nr:long-chain fatty acid--CoA ligase [Actinomycetota bacterium]
MAAYEPSTMQDFPLTVQMIFRHGRKIYGNSECVTFEGESSRRATFEQIAVRAEKLASALKRLGVKPGDRVGTFCWNTQEHLEAYFAIPCMGAVMHTLNLRLFPDQLSYTINHAEDKVIIIDETLIPLLARVVNELKTVEKFIVIGNADASALGTDVLRYEDLIAAEEAGFDWPEVDERAAAATCYTTGTTGDPKGVVYSHRSTVLHTYGSMAAQALGLTERDRVLPIVPMFHANAWGLPYICWFVGADFVMPGRFLQAEPLCKLIEAEKPTFAGAVPTIWNDVLRWSDDHPCDLSSLKHVVCGGSAVPRALMERFQQKHGVVIIQGWGMTETSPLAALAITPKGVADEDMFEWRAKTGRVVAGVELRICDDEGNELPWDGEAQGEIEVRGPWITARYQLDDTPDKFHDGWLRTGDVGSITPNGFIQISDRAKDVIKSGGEWISSVELENTIMAHPDVIEAAVIGVPDADWDERPCACVVLKEGASADPQTLRAFLDGKVARWWLPERWAFIPEVPKTSVGKFDKKVLRARYAGGELEVVQLEGAKRA